MSSAEENGTEVSQMIDCTAIIETVIENTSERRTASIQSILDYAKSQKKQVMEQQNQIKDMVTMVIRIANLIKQELKGEDNLNPGSTGLNDPDGVRQLVDLNVFNDAWSTSGDDQV